MSAPRKPKSAEGLYFVTVRDIPGDDMIALEARADAQGRSVEAEARRILHQALRPKARRVAAS